jgi:hypothetical protein
MWKVSDEPAYASRKFFKVASTLANDLDSKGVPTLAEEIIFYALKEACQ